MPQLWRRLRGRAASELALGKRAKRRTPALDPAHPAGSHRGASAAVGVKRGPARPLLAVRHLGFHRCPEYLREAPTQPDRTYSSVVLGAVSPSQRCLQSSFMNMRPRTPCPTTLPATILPPHPKASLRAIGDYLHTHTQTHTHTHTHTHTLTHSLTHVFSGQLHVC